MPRGGSREGAGRPTEERRIQQPVMLEQRHIDIARDIGEGNISSGVRKALELADKRRAKK